MESRYVGRNVRLPALCRCIEQFFVEKGFETVRIEEKGGYKIIVRTRCDRDIIENVTVLVSGGPNDFVVRFDAGSRSRSFIRFGRVTTFLGGGSFLLRGLKSQEALEKLERNFWVCLEEKIDFLERSTGRDRE